MSEPSFTWPAAFAVAALALSFAAAVWAVAWWAVRVMTHFGAHDAEIARRNAELDTRNRRGCRQTDGQI